MAKKDEGSAFSEHKKSTSQRVSGSAPDDCDAAVTDLRAGLEHLKDMTAEFTLVMVMEKPLVEEFTSKAPSGEPGKGERRPIQK